MSTKRRMLSFHDPLVIATKLTAEEALCMTAMLLFYILQKNTHDHYVVIYVLL